MYILEQRLVKFPCPPRPPFLHPHLTMSRFGMPILVLNLGGEMMYILEQRLVAQKIASEKAKKVIGDILRTMFNPKFIAELFKPQELYSSTSTRQIFERIAHSSIMKLSESSMDKLFDLMTTGFKYQVISCSTPAQLVDITLNHLDNLRSMVKEDQSLQMLLQQTVNMIETTIASLSISSLALLRQTLLRNVQDRKVKVSPFLIEGIQNTDGTMVIQPGGVLPPLFQMPGQIRFFSGEEESFLEYPLPLSEQCQSVGDQYRTHLGFNLYLNSSSKSKTKAMEEQLEASSHPSNTPSKVPAAPQHVGV
mmetsp:Transcript_26541/g.60528  ORF Transcript_26541/g.60528 Transcript_26541/m.60528 type:complete len:307 (-) Transcript_26541:1948-2868(-)